MREALHIAFRKHKPCRKNITKCMKHLKKCIHFVKLSDYGRQRKEQIKCRFTIFFNTTFY
jgi:hypothetical protein